MTPSDASVQDQLAAVDLFSGLSKRQLSRLADQSERIKHTAGREVATEGLGALAFHLIVDGEAQVTTHGHGVRTLGPGDHFGEISMIDGKRRSATVEAVSDLTTIAVPHHQFQQLVDDEPAFARGLLVLLCARLREAENR
jgi:CRP/FNR family cyclic AMP-dependent transcriptional regulator